MKPIRPSIVLSFGLMAAVAVPPAAGQTAPIPEEPAKLIKPAQGKPRLPLVARAPSRAEWTVRLTRNFDSSWGSDMSWEQQTEAAGSDREVRSVNYSKDAGLGSYRLKTNWSDGTSEEEWIILGNHVAERAGGRGLYIVGAEQTLSKELGKTTDFPELIWAEPAHLKGVKAYKGRQVYVFQVEFDQKKLSTDEARMVAFAQQANPKAKPSEVLKPKVSQVILYLDSETQLPVLYNDGTIIRRYDFLPVPSTRLQPPKRTMDFLKARADFLKKRLTPPAGPGG